MSEKQTDRVVDLLDEAVQQLRERCGDSARLEAEVLLGHVLGQDRAWLVVHGGHPVGPAAAHELRKLVEARAAGTPLQYLTGVQEFWSLRFEVDRHTLIPRPESEIVVEETLKRVPRLPSILIDVGTGCGNLAIALARELPAAELFAIDISPAALAVARRNATAHAVAGRIQFHHGDLYAPLAGLGLEGRVDAVVSNPPYVAEQEMDGLMPEVRDHEPRAALVAGPDGTEFYPGLIDGAARLLKPGGALVMELGLGRWDPVRRLLDTSPHFENIEVRRDGAGIDRVTMALLRRVDAGS
jgi:release factor glutamine methyltransferase